MNLHNQMDGFLILDKPKGMTSSQCVYKLRSILGIKKIGHCGTLDPLATGLLPICIGQATKFSGYATDMDKTYEVEVEFGIETDTGDITGKIIKKKDFSSTQKNILTHLTHLEGLHNQTPPMYSAIKKDGNPLYYWARKGVYLFREPKKITIKYVELINFSKNKAKLKISCSKGTYIRSLVEKLGRNLDSFATVTSLKRLKVGKMQLEKNACALDDSKECMIKNILPCDALLTDVDKIQLELEDVKKVRNGLSIDYNAKLENRGLVRIYTEKNSFIGLGLVCENNKVQPKRLLATN